MFVDRHWSQVTVEEKLVRLDVDRTLSSSFAAQIPLGVYQTPKRRSCKQSENMHTLTIFPNFLLQAIFFIFTASYKLNRSFAILKLLSELLRSLVFRNNEHVILSNTPLLFEECYNWLSYKVPQRYNVNSRFIYIPTFKISKISN